jgi:hypothetical protein
MNLIEYRIIELENRIKDLEEQQKKDKAQIAYLLGFIQSIKTKLSI